MKAQVNVDITVNSSRSELGSAAAEEVLELLSAAHRDRRRLLVGVPAGRTLVPVIDALERSLLAAPQPLDHLTIVMMDDYVLRAADGEWAAPPATAHYSCRRFGEDLRARLNAAVGDQPTIPSGQLWSPDPQNPREYDQRIANAGGIDLFFVAVGTSDGHVAFNPPHSSLESRTRVIPLASSTRADNLGTFPEFDSLAEVPSHGVTVGLATIMDARRVEMVAHGAAKAPAIRRILEAHAFDPAWPATLIHEHAEASMRVDAELAGEVPISV